jgi:hypothetical protein
MVTDDRMTGRTTRQLQALPPGSAFVIHGGEMIPYFQRLMETMGRDPREIDFIPLQRARQALEGHFRPGLDVDQHITNLGAAGLLSFDDQDQLMWLVTLISRRNAQATDPERVSGVQPLHRGTLEKVMTSLRPSTDTTPGQWRVRPLEITVTSILMILASLLMVVAAVRS